MRWAIRLHPPSSPGGSREASGSKGRAARQAREDQARKALLPVVMELCLLAFSFLLLDF